MKMLAVLAVLILLAASLLFVLVKNTREPPGLLPGPGFRLPLVGHGHLLRPSLDEALVKMGKKYGKVFTLWLGPKRAIVLSDFDLIRKAGREKKINGRLLPEVRMEIPGYQAELAKTRGAPGLIHASGEAWRVNRRFTINSLGKIKREFDVEASILDDIDSVIRDLEAARSHSGNVVVRQNLFSVATLNTVWHMSTGHKFSKQEARNVRMASDASLDTHRVTLAARAVVNAYPIFRRPFQWLGLSFSPDRTKEIVQMARNDIELSKSHSQRGADKEYHSNHRTLVDRFFGQRVSGEECQQDRDDLAVLLLDLFEGSNHTTSGQICWSLFYMTLHPDVQKKVHNELDLVFGEDNMDLRASYARDRHLTPYTEAVLLETLRLASLVPKTAHQATEDTCLDKYYIPKDSLVISLLGQVHQDPSIFPDPEKFDPCRFLDSDGCFVGDKRVVAFGSGNRRCLGENLAKVQLYLFFTSLLRCFKFQSDGPLSLEVDAGILVCPKPFNVQVAPRWVNKSSTVSL